MMHKKMFRYKVKAYFGNTNLEGNVYWAEFARWFGEAREEFLHQGVPNVIELVETFGIRIATQAFQIKYLKEVFCYDRLEYRITTRMRPASVVLVFRVVRHQIGGEEEVANGEQTLTFVDADNRIIRGVPEPLKSYAFQFDEVG